MAGKEKTTTLSARHFAVDPQALDRLEEQALGESDVAVPDGGDYSAAAQAFDTLGRNIFLLSKAVIGDLVPSAAFNKGARLLRLGEIDHFDCDGNMIGANVKDGNVIYYPSLNVNVSSASCGCSEIRARRMCSHVAALMLAWNQDFTRFVPPADASAVQTHQFMNSPLGQFLRQVTNEPSYPAAMAEWCNLLSPGKNNSPVIEQSSASISTGAGFWPVAPEVRGHQLPLSQIIDQEYSATQLRELGRWLNLKLKGASKSTLIDQVVEALTARVKEMRHNPDALLEGLSDEYAAFMRRLLTARDYQLSVPRTVARAVWAGPGSEQDKAFGVALDELRRRAILFPTLRQYDYRDVYYQWLPLEESRGNVPLTVWPESAVALDEKSGAADEPHTDVLPFLDTLNLFINAVLATGTQVRTTLPRHPNASTVEWLKDWEHESDEAEQLLRSRPGWVPNPQSGISVPLFPWLSADASARLENQTGLPDAQCAFLFDIAAALQLIDAPDPYRKLEQTPDHFIPLPVSWRLNARISVIEAWLARTNEDKFAQAFDAWQMKMLFGYEAWSAVRNAPKAAFKIMRSIGSRDFFSGNLGVEWCALRRFILRTLRGLPANAWIDWATFRHQLFLSFTGDAWRVYNSAVWWFNSDKARLDLSREPDWQRTIGAIVEAMLSEPLRWFGIVDILTDPQQGLRAFRTTEMLAWLQQVEQLDTVSPSITPALPGLPARQIPRPQQSEPIAWLNDTQWRLPPAPDRAEMIVFAHKIAQPATARFTYQLTPASIEHALAQGVSVEDAIRLFESFRAPMPPAAQALFKTIADRFGRVRVYESLSVLELADDYALRELLSNTSLKQHIVYQISPRAVVVETDAIDALKDEMVARGYTPGEGAENNDSNA
ncbi:MAG TPA: helicase-associated domain-containing protein [Anaerolineae bacterium]